MGTRALAVSLLVLPSLALAQAAGQVTVTATISNDINRADCASTTPNVTVRYLVSMSGTFTSGQDQYQFFAGTSACSTTTVPTSGSFAPNETAFNNTIVQSLTVPGDALRAALNVSCTQANDATYYVCVYLVNTSAQIVGVAASSALTLQLAVPPQPSISVAPANSALDVTITPGTIDTTYTATTGITYQAIATPSGGGTPVASRRLASTNLRIENLTNNTPYDVVAYAYSSALNQSPVSATFPGVMPLPFESFWNNYQADNGQEQGGCGGGAGALSLLSLLPLALRRRRP